MARRYNEIKGLAEFAAKRIVEDEQEWMAFLDTSMRVYKYTFKSSLKSAVKDVIAEKEAVTVGREPVIEGKVTAV